MATDENAVSHVGGIVLKIPHFLASVLIYHLSWNKMQSQRPKCSLFHECPLKKITFVLHLGIPEGRIDARSF